MTTRRETKIVQMLTRAFQQRFPEVAAVVNDSPEAMLSEPQKPVLVLAIEAPNPAAGAVKIWVYDDEAEADLDAYGHTHFGSYDRVGTDDELAEFIADQTLDFLAKLFANRILLWRSGDKGDFEHLDQYTALSEMAHVPADARAELWTKSYVRPSYKTAD